MSIYPTSGAITFSSLPGYFQDSSATNPIALSEFNEFLGFPNQAPYPAIGTVQLSTSSVYGKARGTPGLMYKIFKGYYDGDVTYFDSAELVATGITRDFTNISAATGGYVSETTAWEDYSIEWTGIFYAEQPKDVSFGITSNASCQLYVDGSLVADTVTGDGSGQVILPTEADMNAGRTAACYSFRIVYGLSTGTGTGTFSLVISEYYGYFPDYDEFTRNLLTPYYIPPSGLVGWYDVGSWTGSQWTDKSGAGNHAVLTSGIVSATGNTLSGTPDDGLLWPAAILPATYTLFYVARYNSDPGYGSRGRIFNGYSTNWLSGFWNSFTGVAYHSDATGWVTDPYNGVGANNEWIVGCDRNTSLRCNGKLLGSVGAGNSDRLCINARPGGNGEYSDWAVSDVIVYNRALSLTEILQVEAYLFAKNAVRLMYDFDLMSSTARAAVTCVFSMRHVRLLHFGPMFQVRRASDNAVVDVYASRTGAHGLSFGGTGTSPASWAAGATMYVTTWYNQAGPDFEWSDWHYWNHATQYDEELQPLYDAAKGCINFRTNRWFSLGDGTVPSFNQAYTVIAKHGAIDATHGAILSSGPELLTNRSNTFRRSATSYVNYWWSNDYIAGTYAANNRVVWTYDESGRQMYVNGTPTTFTAASGRDSGTTDNFIGRDAVNSQSFNYLNGDLYYLHIFSAALTASDHSLLTSV